jgi:hypothetical protein
VRIAGYGWIARFYAERGPRAACLLAALGSVLATLGYAEGPKVGSPAPYGLAADLIRGDL